MSLNLLRTASNKVAFVMPTPKSVSALFSKNSFSMVMAGMMSAAVAVDELIFFEKSKESDHILKLAEEVDLSQY